MQIRNREVLIHKDLADDTIQQFYQIKQHEFKKNSIKTSDNIEMIWEKLKTNVLKVATDALEKKQRTEI